MPKLWNDTIEAHRQEVREAILETTAKLVARDGLRAVTMQEVAEVTGIGRATLYKYFPGIEEILAAWHQREIDRHLALLAAARDQLVDPAERLRAVLQTYAEIARGLMSHHPGDGTLAAHLHHGHQAARADERLRELVRQLIVEGIGGGKVRKDVPAAELAGYCVHAMRTHDSASTTKATTARLVTVVMDGLRPSRQ